MSNLQQLEQINQRRQTQNLYYVLKGDRVQWLGQNWHGVITGLNANETWILWSTNLTHRYFNLDYQVMTERYDVTDNQPIVLRFRTLNRVFRPDQNNPNFLLP